MPNDDTANPEIDAIVRELQTTESTLRKQRYALFDALKKKYTELENELRAQEAKSNALRAQVHEVGGQINGLHHLLTTSTLEQMRSRNPESQRRR